MKIYIIIAKTWSDLEGCWFDVYYDAMLDENEAYKCALAKSNQADATKIQYIVEEIML
jgi:hypothetical protein